MRVLRQSLVISAFGLLLVACATTDDTINREAKIELDPMPLPPPGDVGHVTRMLDKGQPVTIKTTALGEESETREIIEGRRQGCNWTRNPKNGWFTPAVSWENCRGGSTGKAQVEKTGDIWPLKVGNSETYKVEGKSNKSSWSITRTCKVTSSVLVSVREKQIPSYEVVCKDRNDTFYWYVSPDLKKAVKYKKINKKRGVDDDMIAILE